MKRTFPFLLLCIAISTASAKEPKPTAKSILEFGGGDAPGTAKLTKFPYARHLRSAVQMQDDGLGHLFRFTDSESFIGSGAESHCIALRDLLRLWGDREFARVLAAESPKVRSAVIAALDYTWPHPGWQPKEFPATYRLAKHNTNYRQ